MFTSDHGYKSGQFVYHGKRRPYETDIHVTLAVRGPGVRKGAVEPRLVVASVDLAPTLLEIAGVPEAGEDMDGSSFLHLLKENNEVCFVI